MGKNVTIGGDRLGSGKKMQSHLHNYFRSTHNLSQNWASTAACGILYPCLCIPAMRGDSFDISLNADLRTIPTKAPLFGSFKMQVDLFQVPMRLYQGILHNNPLAIGLKMSQVLFPTLKCQFGSSTKIKLGSKFATNSLLKYLGMSGLGRTNSAQSEILDREINAVPALAYFDIFKNYYANKQEDKAYQIAYGYESKEIGTQGNYFYYSYYDQPGIFASEFGAATGNVSTLSGVPNIDYFTIYIPIKGNISDIREEVNTDTFINYSYVSSGNIVNQTISAKSFFDSLNTTSLIKYISQTKTGVYAQYSKEPVQVYNQETEKYTILTSYIKIYFRKDSNVTTVNNVSVMINSISETKVTPKELALHTFDLKNIDDMRYDLLSSNELGVKVTIDAATAYAPYKCLVDTDANQTKMNGLVVKTYQNDIFNNWLNTEWIEGENGINELTKVEIVDGAFSMDALNFAQKLYNMLNRIAVAGATYEDWQDVVYETVKRRQIESPIFCGGMSKEVLFDEIIQNAPTNLEGDIQPLGTLGGRGRLSAGQKGGKVHIKCDEASFIIGIMSITPRIYQTQGNEFYMTELKSMDDLHKPAMDGIGFQDLIGERMAWWDTLVNSNGTLSRNKVGKLPAWIEYMTAVDKAYGEFAEPDEAGFMILARNYEQDPDTGGIKDATTYIDPKKYNYAFANTELTAQNFWAQIGFNIKARRLMSARLIPHV